MKNIIAVLLMMQLLQPAAKAGESINFFQGAFSEALAKAKEQNKLLFLDCYTTWCGPCKWMTANVFTNDTVYNYFNDKFICMMLDMEKGEGLEIRKKYSVKNFPTYLWVDANGKQVHRSVGSTQVPSFMRIAANATNPELNLSYLEEKYTSGNRDPILLMNYAKGLRDAYNMNYQVVIDEYFRTQSAEQLSSEANWKMILEYTPNMNSSVYNTIENNPAPFNKHYGKDSVQHMLDNLALESMRFASQKNDSALLEKAAARLQHSNNKMIQKEAARGELDFYKRNENMKKYTELAPGYVTKVLWDDAKALNEICWTYFMKVEEKDKLAESEKWIAQSVKLDDSYYNTDTYANILHKEGKHKEALEMTQHSIELAKKSKEDYTSTKELLDIINKEMSTAKGK